MQLRALGPVATIGASGEHKSLRGQQAEVLGLLMAHHPQAVRSDLLTEALWGEDAPSSSATGLRVVVARLRDRIEDDRVEIVHDGDGYRLSAPPECLDIAEFRELVAQAHSSMSNGDHGDAANLVSRALDLWRGRPFQQCENDPWLESAATVLEQERLDAEELLIEAHIESGMHDRAAALASQATSAEPFREHRWELLLIALYSSGRQAEALRAAQRARQMFADELGLDLSPRLVDLERRILEHDESLAAKPSTPEANEGADTAMAPAPSLAPRPNPTPTPSSSFFGREDTLAELARLVADHRLVTIVGAGGAGKTRLAGQFAISAGDSRTIWLNLVEPRPCRTVVDCLAEQLGIRPASSNAELIDLVAMELSSEPTLLVVDNCEDDVAEVAAVAEQLLRQTETLRILATSRVGLGSESETRLELGALDTGAARRLLRARAFGASEAPALDPERLDQLIATLDGLPLALELVASQLRVLGPDDLTAILESSLSVLDAPNRSEVRHRRLSETIDGSLDRVKPRAVDLLERLSVLNDRFTMDDAYAITDRDRPDKAAVAADMQQLVDHSLVERESQRVPSFRLLSTVRTRCRERLAERGDFESAVANQADVFTDLVMRLEPDLSGEREESAVVRLNTAIEHVRAAFEHKVSAGDVERAAEIAIGIHDYSVLRLVWPNFGWAERVLACEGAADLERLAELQACAALGAWADQRFGDGERLAGESLATSSQRGEDPSFRALSAQFNLAAQQGRFAEAAELQATLMARPGFRRVPQEGVLTLGNLALGFSHAGMTTDAQRAALECLPIAQASGNASLIAWGHYALGESQSADDPAEAVRSLAEAVRLSLTVDNRWSQGMAMAASVSCLRRLGRLDEASATTLELIEHWHRARFSSNLRHALFQAVMIMAVRGNVEPARRVLAAIVSDRSTHPLHPIDRSDLETVRTELGALPVGVQLNRPLLDEAVEALGQT